MVERSNEQMFGRATLQYEITDRNQVIIHIKMLQSNELFKQQRQQVLKHLCLMVDDSGSMTLTDTGHGSKNRI